MLLEEEEDNRRHNSNHRPPRPVDDVARDLFLACQQKPLRLERIQSLLHENPESAKSKDEQGRLPLEVACLLGEPSLEIVRCLVECYPDAVQVRKKDGDDDDDDDDEGEILNERLPIHYACRGRAPLEVIEYLLEVEPKAISAPGLDGMLPLHEACLTDENDGNTLPMLSFPLIQFLVSRHPEALSIPSAAQLLPLDYAVCTSNVTLEVIQYLVEQNPDSVTVSSHQELLPIHLAAYFCESPQVFEYLYRAYPVAISKKDALGCLPLHIACAAKATPELILNIISWHPEALQIEDGFGRLPLHICCLMDAPLVVIQRMTELFPQSITMKDSEGEGELPLDMACRSRLQEEEEAPQQLVEVLECLVGDDGLPPLHFACYYQASAKTLRFLHETFPTMLTTVAGMDDYRPLHYVCCNSSGGGNDDREVEQFESVEFLLQEDPDAIHVRSTTTGELPLHLACRHHASLDVVERLFEESPASVKSMDNRGLTPLVTACWHGAELDIIFFLTSKDPGQLLVALGKQ